MLLVLPVAGEAMTRRGFRDLVAFPGFDDIPDEDDVFHKHYLVNRDGVVTARRHWCLLGQIVEAFHFIRMRIAARDRTGRAFMIHCHIEEHLSTLSFRDIKPGNVLAIMAPERHRFSDGTIGIRLESADAVFAFRSGLSPLMAEGAKILNGERCFECGKPALEKCKNCNIAKYCSVECAVKHRREVHEDLCSQMPMLRSLLQADFSIPPQKHFHGFTELASAVGALPRPCFCGFHDKELSNSEECELWGLGNHVDYPPAACLPWTGDSSQQFYYSVNGTPRRHWALVAEVDEVRRDGLRAETQFGEQVHLTGDSGWEASVWKPGHCFSMSVGSPVSYSAFGFQVVGSCEVQACRHLWYKLFGCSG